MKCLKGKHNIKDYRMPVSPRIGDYIDKTNLTKTLCST